MHGYIYALRGSLKREHAAYETFFCREALKAGGFGRATRDSVKSAQLFPGRAANAEAVSVAPRLPRETRTAFIRRVLRGET
jgi:hypothetical protein